MRDKEAIETERKNLSRTIEKQGKAVDRFTDVEKSMRAQAVSSSVILLACDLTPSQGVMEKENVLLKKMVDVLNSRVEQLEKETFECRSLAEAERKKAQEVRPIEPL
jgi:E3 ubiquitin-protein ligase BRE1